MQNTAKGQVAGRVRLDTATEARFLAATEAVGGRVLEPDRGELAALMADTVELLWRLDAALLPPVIQDRVNTEEGQQIG